VSRAGQITLLYDEDAAEEQGWPDHSFYDESAAEEQGWPDHSFL
jgi:hypothetical protein